MASAISRINYFILNKSLCSNVGKIFGLQTVRSFHLTDTQKGLKSKWRAPALREMKRRVDTMKEKGTYPLNIRSQYLEWNYDAELYAVGKRLNEEFDDALLREAFTDSSYIFEETQRLQNLGVEKSTLEMKDNRDLAEAGRALIKDFSTKYLRATCPLLPEEGIESFVDHLTSDEVLSHVSQNLGFRDLILTQEYPPSERTFANCFSAVVGCLNASSGLQRSQKFILDFVVTQLVGKDLWDIWKVDDPLHLLREILRRSGGGEPEPRLMGDLGRETIEAVFHVGIYDQNKEFVGQGFGESVDVAIEVAAYDSLSRLFGQSASRSPLPFSQETGSIPSKAEPNSNLNEWTINKDT